MLGCKFINSKVGSGRVGCVLCWRALDSTPFIFSVIFFGGRKVDFHLNYLWM